MCIIKNRICSPHLYIIFMKTTHCIDWEKYKKCSRYGVIKVAFKELWPDPWVRGRIFFNYIICATHNKLYPGNF